LLGKKGYVVVVVVSTWIPDQPSMISILLYNIA